MIILIALLFLALLLRDLIFIERQYIHFLQYTVPFVLGIGLLLIFWFSVIYYELISHNSIPYIIILMLPLGFTLFFKGKLNLCILKGKFDREYAICHRAYKWLIILDVYIIVASLLYKFTY